MDRVEAIARLRSARVGRLATVTPEARPHVVPFVFALVERDRDVLAYWAVDRKPKRSERLQRLRNLEGQPRRGVRGGRVRRGLARALVGPGVGDRARDRRCLGRTRVRARGARGQVPADTSDPPPGPVVAIDIERSRAGRRNPKVARGPAVRTDRLETFADGVFAIAATLLILNVTRRSGRDDLGTVSSRSASYDRQLPHDRPLGSPHAHGKVERAFGSSCSDRLPPVVRSSVPDRLVAEPSGGGALGLRLRSRSPRPRDSMLVWFYAGVRRAAPRRLDPGSQGITRSYLPEPCVPRGHAPRS